MKKLFFTLFFTMSLMSQNIKAVYSIKLLDNGEVEKSDMGFLYNKSKEDALKFEFNLLFSKTNANFFLVETMSHENLSLSSMKLFSRYKGLIFSDTTHNYIEKNIDYKKNILKSKINKNWLLTKEFKKIQNYECYKATSKEIITTSRGKFEYDIVAWYCPELPYQFGPNGFGGLPGLIFELQFDKVLYGLKSINFNDNSLKIETIDSNKVLTDAEYSQIIQEIKKSKFE